MLRRFERVGREGPRILEQIGDTKLALQRHSGAKQTKAPLHISGLSSNEAVTVAHNKAFLVFTASAVLSA